MDALNYLDVQLQIARDLTCIRNARGITLLVQRGMVWVTQQGSTQDTLLAAGESFVIDCSGLTLVCSLGATPLALVALLAPARPTSSALRTWKVALSGWFCRGSRFPGRVSPSRA